MDYRYVCTSLQAPVSEEPEQPPSSPQLDQHQVYSLNDYQPFESNTYSGQSVPVFCLQYMPFSVGEEIALAAD